MTVFDYFPKNIDLEKIVCLFFLYLLLVYNQDTLNKKISFKS